MELAGLSKSKLKLYSSLSLKKYRYKLGQFIVEGHKMVTEAVRSGWEVEALLLLEGTDPVGWEPNGRPVYSVSAGQLRQLSQQKSPEGALAVVNFPFLGQKSVDLIEHWPTGPGFILEDIQDPGNLGTLVRTADWFGFKHIICSKGTVDAFNPKALRSSMGSIFRVKIHYVEAWLPLIEAMGDHIWVADLRGEPLQSAELGKQDYILIGNEAKGISSMISDLPGLKRLHIPGAGGAESLNAAISAGIMGWQLFCRGKL